MSNWFWVQFATICIVGAMSPGPPMALIIRNSIKYGRVSGILSSVGHAIGIGIYAVQKILQNDKGEHISMPIFAIFMCVWSTFMTEIWKGHQARYAMEWLVAFSL